MQKIPTLFQRNPLTRQVIDEVNPVCAWVAAGAGIATRKLDGTCCLMRNDQLCKRYEVKAGSTPPPGFEPAGETDDVTGKQQGWLPIGNGPEDRWHREGLVNTLALRLDGSPIPDGTYELLGPKIQGNPEQAELHYLETHGAEKLPGVPREFSALCDYLASHDIEGIVWHHADGRRCKLKKKDFGLPRKPR